MMKIKSLRMKEKNKKKKLWVQFFHWHIFNKIKKIIFTNKNNKNMKETNK